MSVHFPSRQTLWSEVFTGISTALQFIWREMYYLNATNITFSNTQKGLLLAQGTDFLLYL